MGTITERKTKNGTTRYRAQIQITVDGKRVRSESKTFSTKRLAREWIDRRESDLAAVDDVSVDYQMTLGEGILHYLDAVGENFSRTPNFTLRAIVDRPIGSIRLDKLTVKDLVEYVAWRKAQPLTPTHPNPVGPATLNQDLIYIRIAMRYLYATGMTRTSSAVVSEAMEVLRATRQISKSGKRERRPTYDEIEALDAYFWDKWQAGRTIVPMWHIMWFAIESSRRQDEIMRLPLDGFDPAHEVYVVSGGLKDPKGRVSKRVEARLHKHGWMVYDCIKKDLNYKEFLFECNRRTVGADWSRATKMLGIDDLRFHDLRHEALSRLGEDGLTVPQIQQVSLHESWDSLRRYVNMPARRGKRFEFTNSIRFKK